MRYKGEEKRVVITEDEYEQLTRSARGYAPTAMRVSSTRPHALQARAHLTSPAVTKRTPDGGFQSARRCSTGAAFAARACAGAEWADRVEEAEQQLEEQAAVIQVCSWAARLSCGQNESSCAGSVGMSIAAWPLTSSTLLAFMCHRTSSLQTPA